MKIEARHPFIIRKAEQFPERTIYDRIEDIRACWEIQGSDGNWNTGDEYMVGLFNGLEVAMCILEHREPEFRSLDDALDSDYLKNKLDEEEI